MDTKTPHMNPMQAEAAAPLFAVAGGAVVTWLSLVVSVSQQINPLLQTIALALGILSSVYAICTAMKKARIAKYRRKRNQP